LPFLQKPRMAMRLYKLFALIMCFCLAPALLAQASASQRPQNDEGVIGDNGEEPDQPVTQPAATSVDPANGTSTAWEMLETALKETKPQLRIDALNALGTITSSKRAEGLLQGSLQDKDVDVRIAAIAAVGTMQDPNMIPTLRQALDDPAPEVDFAAAVSLWKMHDPTGINVLYGVLTGERRANDTFMKSGMHEANKDMHDPGTLAKIGAKQGAYALLGPFGIGLDAARLMAKSNNANSARVLTATLLSEDQSDLTRQEFIAALRDKDYFVRAASARALGRFHGKDVTDALLPAFGDSKPTVRYMAAAAYIRSNQPVPDVPAKPVRKPTKKH
jgi:HEAT repeat protein